MSNQNKTQYLKTTLLSLSFATLGLISVANSANSPFAQSDKQTTKQAIKGDVKKCGEGKCGDSMKKSEVKQVKKVTDGKADIIEDETQEAVPTSEVNTQEEKSKKVEKKCGG
jgi:uncharacterized low-complexity protein